MTSIELGHGYRIVRLDDLNWKMQRLRSSKWRDEGTYFQTLDRAVAYVYEHVLREGDGRDVELGDALKEARELRDSLLTVGQSLREPALAAGA